MLVTVGGTVVIWQLKTTVTGQLAGGLDVVNNTIDATTTALLAVQTSLETAQESVIILETTATTLSKSIADTNPIVNDLADMLETQLPRTLTSTEAALTAAQDSANVIEGVLRAVTSIPFLPLPPYQPDVPLSVSLGQVSQSLDGLPELLTSMAGNLTTTNSNLKVLTVETQLLAENIKKIDTSLVTAKQAVTQYQGVVAALKAQISQVKASLPVAFDAVAWGLTAFLIWLAVTQLGLLTQGIELWSEAVRPSRAPAEIAPVEQKNE
jgi:hypothetical protein